MLETKTSKIYETNIISRLFEILNEMHTNRTADSLREDILTLEHNNKKYNFRLGYDNGLLTKVEVWKEEQKYYPYFTAERKDKKQGSITIEGKYIPNLREVLEVVKQYV